MGRLVFAECGFALERSRAMALNKQGDTLGPAELRVARGLTYVVPVKGAFSYRLTRDAGVTWTATVLSKVPIGSV